MAKTMPISEVKTRLPELVSGVEEREDEIVVTRNGKPAAVLINYNEYERLKETLDVLSDPVSMRQIAQSKRFYAKQQQGESFEALFGEPLISVNGANDNGGISGRYPDSHSGTHSPFTTGTKTGHQASAAVVKFRSLLWNAANRRI